MTIVASNSLTLSNVNDGTITHTAYANSAEGTLDFTPDYKSAVGLDTLDITKWAKNAPMTNSTYNFAKNADNSFKVTGRGTGGYEVLSKSFPAKVGDKLRFTVRYTNRLAFGLFNNYGLQFVVNGTYTEGVELTSKIVLPQEITTSTEYQLEYTVTTDNVWMQLNFGGVADSSQVDFDVKIEVENLTNPVKYAYMGTYTDTTIADSNNYADYTWLRIKGNDGKAGDMGKSVWSYPYDRGANRLGSWWSDLKPTPTTDNPPKVGDTIIDLVGKIYQITNVVVGTTQEGGGLFDYGPMLTSVKGADGDPGKVVSDTEPTTRFKGLTWKYSGTADLTASDGTVIKPNIEYYFNGTKWVISLIEANQINVDTLAAISAYLGHVYAAIVEDKQSNGSGFLLDSEKQVLRVNKTSNTYNQIFSEGLTTFAKISDLPGIGNIIPGANYISAILAGNFLQFGQYSTAVNSNGVPVGGVSVGEGSISFGQTTSGSYGFTLTGDLTVAGNIKSLKDTDWIDIPPASGWGGIMRYMIAEGKFYLRLSGVTNPAVPAATARTMCTIPTTAVPLGGIRGIPILSYGEPVAELVINANGTVQFYPHNAVGTGLSLHVFVQGIPLT